MRARQILFVFLLVSMPWFAGPAGLQAQPPTNYAAPPSEVQRIFETDKHMTVLDNPSPDRKLFLIEHMTELSTLPQMAKPTLRLAMLEIRPSVFREWRADTFGVDRLEIFTLLNQQRRRVTGGDGLVSEAQFSPDSQSLAFVLHGAQASELFVAPIASCEAKRVTAAAVVATLAVTPSSGRRSAEPSRLLSWTPEGSLITLLVPDNIGNPPERTLPSGPLVRSSEEAPLPTPTYPFLLRDAHDENLFRYYTRSQLAEVSLNGEVTKLGEPAMYLGFRLSPDGRHILTDEIVDPLSRRVGYTSFAERQRVLDRSGRALATIRELVVNEDSTRNRADREKDAPRSVAWRPGSSELVFFLRTPEPEPESGQDVGSDEDVSATSDRLLSVASPFDLANASTLVEVPGSLRDAVFDATGEWVVATVGSESEDPTERIVAYQVDGSDRQAPLTVAGPYDPDSVTSLPGAPLVERIASGTRRLIRSSNGGFYLRGEGFASDLRHRPFIDRVELSGKTTRLFRSSRDVYETPVVAIDSDLQEILVQRESKTAFPDTYLMRSGKTPLNLTRSRDPFPEITSAERLDFDFERRDGLKIRARISLPVGHEPGQKVPAIFWTYPREYASAEDYENASIRSRNRNAYTELTYLRWSDIWLTQGYAVVHPDVPIIKDEGSYNENYIQHLVDTLYAAIRKVDSLGLVDIDRIGHGGHSYGAFATANLLVRTPYFKAGIAGNGAYNRTLTPMGFQGERRFLWQVPSLYLEMSPFFQADHLDTPLLMYHGLDDNNTGTYPIQSERFMQALTGLGKKAVLYLYPFESHTPRAKKTYLDLWARWLAWFDEHVKNSKQ